MFVAIMQVELRLHHPRNLKERRRIVSSLKDRLHHRYRVSVAEVGNGAVYTEAVLGIALVSNDPRHARQRAQKVMGFLENARDAEVVDAQTEVL